MITSFDTLSTEVGAYTHRTDLGPRMETFIQITESRLNRILDLTELEVLTTSNPATMPDDLPETFSRMRAVVVNGFNVKPITIGKAAEIYRNAAPGRSWHYIVHQTQYRLYPFTAGAEVQLVYLRDLTPITAATPASSVLTKYPELYLWGTLTEAFRFMQDIEAMQAADVLFLELVTNANLQSERSRWGEDLQMTGG